MKILLSDDEQGFRSNLARGLAKAGHTVAEASNGNEAMALLNSTGDFEALISDVYMGGATGIELAVAFHKKFPGAKICIMSGNFDSSTDLSGEAKQIPIFFQSKPFPRQILIDWLNSPSASQ